MISVRASASCGSVGPEPASPGLSTIILLFVVGVLCARTFVTTANPIEKNGPTIPNPIDQPELRLINDLDKVIQHRFLTLPAFGIRRIGPNPNPHLEHFEPHTADERLVVANLERGDWKVGIYLMGRRAYELPDIKNLNGPKQLTVQYKLNDPVPVTSNVKKSELYGPKRLRDGVDKAFERFREGDTFDFSIGEWSYVARPVRAGEACMKCHQDMFVTAKVGNKKYQYRNRRVGDAIGVLVYAFRKKN